MRQLKSLQVCPYYLLPTIYYMLPTTYYLLPTTYYLLPTRVVMPFNSEAPALLL